MKFTKNHIVIGLFAFILYGALVIFEYYSNLSFSKQDWAGSEYSINIHNSVMFFYRTIYLTALFFGTYFLFFVLKPRKISFPYVLLAATVSFIVSLIWYRYGFLYVLPVVACFTYVSCYVILSSLKMTK